MTRLRKSQKNTVQNETEATRGRKDGGRQGRGCGHGCGHCHGSKNQSIESSNAGRSEAHKAQSSKSSLNVITISEDEPESALYDDAPYDFSVSEQLQLKDKPFKLDCSAIIDNSTKIYEDSREIEAISESDGDGDNIEDSGESSKSSDENYGERRKTRQLVTSHDSKKGNMTSSNSIEIDWSSFTHSFIRIDDPLFSQDTVPSRYNEP
ncbi:hypothetical protein RhiirC2_777745 [Rhizophagus irregularis]|uniref:Uncharacterized protein n=1 Tax=Rhizophagus irregularis TaxID=588596 RepID=A0A2N1NDI9_9GLOM|nr:hypothetical protein RhiirC2_777745 [Rhizophagus irregularis]